MIYFLIGHRGVGKTAFLQRVRSYYQSYGQLCQTYDLDQEIELHEDTTIAQILSTQGEAYFRELEERVLHKLVKNVSGDGAVYISLGAGYQGALPNEGKVIWLRRVTDRNGRIFIDRPRLDRELNPLEEFLQRFDTRDERYRAQYDSEITVGEGWDFTNPFEPALLGLRPAALDFSVTILPEHLERPGRLESLLNECQQLGARYIELRDDLLAEDQIKRVSEMIPNDKVLISFRLHPSSPSLQQFAGPFATDWDISLGPSPFAHNAIVSLHTRLDGESVDDAASRLLAVKADHHKLAIEIQSFVELWSGHRFYDSNGEKRSFLPRSANGRWRWYRLVHSRSMKLNFARRGDGSSADQPFFFDFLRYPANATRFAAVLGQPVEHSRTPAEQADFFRERGLGTVAITMSEDECDALNISILERIGMAAAAVTSPLKKRIMDVCHHVDRRSVELSAVNTIVRTPVGWQGTNTDLTGMQKLLDTVELPSDAVVWGGGGTRMMLRALLPQAHFFSARRGEEIWVEKPEPVSPEVVIWAVGRSRQVATQRPPAHWQPKYIIDLNYTEDSPGLEYALDTGARYISGRGLFKNQAHAQREFWAKADFASMGAPK